MEFVKGMDLSTLLELERCGAKYYDEGKETDILAVMKKYDVDTIRIRLWNDPWSESGESYGAGENDLKTSLEIAKRVTAAGFGVLLNFHYSDFWADPGKQRVPKAWRGMDAVQLEQAVYDFTRNTLLAMRQAGARTIGQDESTCVVYGMPKVAYDIGAVEYQEKLHDIARKTYSVLNTM